jgi:hypothetical protein
MAEMEGFGVADLGQDFQGFGQAGARPVEILVAIGHKDPPAWERPTRLPVNPKAATISVLLAMRETIRWSGTMPPY